MTIGTDGHTPFGASPEDVAAWLDGLGVDVIGLNCSVGPQGILDGIERMVHTTRRKLSAQPNAGMPRDVGGRAMYMASAEYMATYARHLVQAGAKIVGGCCGTTPEHIHAIAEGVRPLNPRLGRFTPLASPVVEAPRPQAPGPVVQQPKSVQPVPFGTRSKFAAKIAAKEFVTSVEIVPPRGV